MTVVQGTADAAFAPLRDLLEQQFANNEHIGTAVCVYHHGHVVADLWGGLADEDAGTPWQRDTMCLSYSTTKGLTATCLHLLADRGLVDYDAPVATYWPEFAKHGKGKITVYHVLTHQAGIPQMPDNAQGAGLLDWDGVIRGIEDEAPIWEPGTDTGYHGVSFGFLVGEIVRRVSGRSVGRFLRDEICAQLGLRDMYIGAPADVEPSIAKLKNRIVITPELLQRIQERAQDGEEGVLSARISGARPGGMMAGPDNPIDTPEGHRAEVPAINGVMTARDLARFYACLAGYGEIDGVRLLSEDRVRTMSKLQTRRLDRVIRVEVGWALGYMTGGAPGWPQGPRETSFGHPGFGGSIGFCDPEIGMAFGFTTNAIQFDLVGTARAAALAAAARACAESATPA